MRALYIDDRNQLCSSQKLQPKNDVQNNPIMSNGLMLLQASRIYPYTETNFTYSSAVKNGATGDDNETGIVRFTARCDEPVDYNYTLFVYLMWDASAAVLARIALAGVGNVFAIAAGVARRA
uniref:Uncharacterized protein n=1 Tax=Romanomermis culicivorax TaxID=13658 RepID=A0A915JHR6_ROMCU